MGQICCCTQVHESEVAIKEKFGRFDAVLQPGFHFLPWFLGYRVAGLLSLRVQQQCIRCETKTKDNVFVTLVASVQYRALSEKATSAFYKLSNTRDQIQAYVFDVIRSCVPKMNLDAVFEQKDDVRKAVEKELQKAMTDYGYDIVETLIVDVVPVESVKNAMNQINAAQRLRIAAQDKAEAEKVLQIKQAESEAEAKYLAGLGTAKQRQAILDGQRDCAIGLLGNVPGVSAKDVMEVIMITQYFDTMKEAGASSESSAMFIPHRPGATGSIAEQIRNGSFQLQVQENQLI
eukprot:TRINITY_DN5988_c0_g1_i1.p1 TRINITY_DN5988_c0_g1~~TRINITY_DN5988_c0_g1_i1.p1  ORF type:complete len:290 (-),score=57.54 TRINITY_DN5988_c0_g1_i1:647-1516(-)